MNMSVNKGSLVFVGLSFLRELKFQQFQEFLLECSLFFHYLNMKENMCISKFHQIIKKKILLF